MPELHASEEDLRVYEFCVLYPANLSQKDENTLLKNVESTIEEQGAKQVGKDLWGKRGLAYAIKGNTEGCFAIWHYEMDPSKIKEIDEALRIMANVLRHMVVKPPQGYQIVKYSEKYEGWLKDREAVDERKSREREQRLAEKVAEKAKRQVRKAAKKDEETVAKPKADTKQISDELDKIISDDNLNL